MNSGVVNIGSINVDHVYAVDRFVRPGETQASTTYRRFAGGKGFNQSVALARAGARIRHAGKIGADAAWLRDRLREEGVDTTHVGMADGPTGHAIIQVAPSGENAIVLCAGANTAVTAADIEVALSAGAPGEILLVQNETSSVAHALRIGKQREFQVFFNPAPLTLDVAEYPLHCVDLFVLNETEAKGLTGQSEIEAMLEVLLYRFPDAKFVVTMGSRGAHYADASSRHWQPAFPVEAMDTTGAGDTFIGYFIAELQQSGDPAKALELGCRAASVCVTRPGAADSIPGRRQLATRP